MPNGGRVVVKLQHEPESDTVDLVVRDYGLGIPSEALPHIFDPFFTTKKGPDATGKGGTGLGLATCKDIIEAHHGRIRVESTIGKGTAFTLKLPIARVPASHGAPLPVAMPQATSQASVGTT
jgi:signal transduction histidine kinase